MLFLRAEQAGAQRSMQMVFAAITLSIGGSLFEKLGPHWMHTVLAGGGALFIPTMYPTTARPSLLDKEHPALGCQQIRASPAGLSSLSRLPTSPGLCKRVLKVMVFWAAGVALIATRHRRRKRWRRRRCRRQRRADNGRRQRRRACRSLPVRAALAFHATIVD